MKKCVKCNNFKDISEFPRRKRSKECNLMLGLAKDNPDIFNNAVEYLNDACI